MKEIFPDPGENPEEKEASVEVRSVIEQVAMYLSAEVDRSLINEEFAKHLRDPNIRAEAGRYMERMNKLERLQAVKPEAIGPAAYEDLKRFQEGVARFEQLLEERSKLKHKRREDEQGS
ncbi:MAG: hypothetical protein AAB518_00190 [Patescibacteria group bacterium]